MCASRRHRLESANTLTRGVADPEAESSETTVLVVDDEPQVGSLAGAYLKRLETQLTVVVETDPRDALARFEVGDVDCVVSDYEMPAMDGLELLEAVRESDSTAPFVLFTACDDETLARRARNRDAAYLQKNGSAGGFDRLSEHVADTLADTG
ncbi:MAG: response regulator [Haloarculaceae archaeon]